MIKSKLSGINCQQILVHGLIFLLFLAYCIFFAVPLFNMLENTGTESRLTNISLPAETDDTRLAIDRIAVIDARVEVEGWAAIAGQTGSDIQIFVVLKGNKNTFTFQPTQYSRGDAAKALGLALDDDNFGFLALIPGDEIRPGIYKLGICVKSGGAQALQYTDWIITKSAGTIALSNRSSTQ